MTQFVENGVDKMWIVNGVVNAAKYVLNPNTLSAAVSSVSKFTWGTLTTAASIPSYFINTAKSPKARTLLTNTGRIALDFAPIVIATTANAMIQDYIDGSEELMPQIFSLLATSLNTAIYYRQLAKATVHTTVMMTGHKKVFDETTKDKRPPLKDICKVEKCTTKRKVKGEVRDLITYILEDGLLSLAGYIPYVGSFLSLAGKMLHNGQYFLASRYSAEGMCDRHRQENLRENPEFCMQLGVAHFVAVQAICMLLEKSPLLCTQLFTTLGVNQVLPKAALEGLQSLSALLANTPGIPRSLYESTVNKLMTLYFIGLTFHMNSIPKPVAKSKRIGDPMDLIVRQPLAAIIDFLIAVVGPGAKKEIKRLLKQKNEDPIDFKALATKAYKVVSSPTYQTLGRIVLPKQLISLEAFVSDPVNHTYWVGLRSNLIDGIKAYQEVRDESWVVWGVTKLPKWAVNWTVKPLAAKFGKVPKPVTGAAIGLLNDKEINDLIDLVSKKLNTYGDGETVIIPQKKTKQRTVEKSPPPRKRIINVSEQKSLHSSTAIEELDSKESKHEVTLEKEMSGKQKEELARPKIKPGLTPVLFFPMPQTKVRKRKINTKAQKPVLTEEDKHPKEKKGIVQQEKSQREQKLSEFSSGPMLVVFPMSNPTVRKRLIATGKSKVGHEEKSVEEKEFKIKSQASGSLNPSNMNYNA